MIRPILISAILVAASGCTTWHNDSPPRSPAFSLPTPKREPGAAVLDIAFVSIDTRADIEKLWESIDQTVIPLDVRQGWELNGLRIGRVQKPIDFDQRLAAIRRKSEESHGAMEATDVLSDLSHEDRRITCRIGKRYELPVRQPATEDQSVLLRIGADTVGRTLSRSQPLFAIRATAADIHSIQLALSPAIQHGELKQTWVGSDAALRLDNRRESWNLDELLAETRLDQGSILVVGSIMPPIGLGRMMFTGVTAEGDEDRVVMVIRVTELPELDYR
ncbi:MAG: hypothetical protein RI963_93 [Planctomycetota bacterium]|jgi:hypothetical protein